jgi:hypothetical protein
LLIGPSRFKFTEGLPFQVDQFSGGSPQLVAEPLEDPAGGVPLLPGSLLVGREDPVDDREERFELGLGAGGGAAVSRRLGVMEDLLEGIPVDIELAADGSFALAVDEDATADLGPVLHVDEHP